MSRRAGLRRAGPAVAAGLLLLLTASTAAAQQPERGRSPVPVYIKYGKWVTLAASLAMNYLAWQSHDQAEEAFGVIEAACRRDRSRCATLPNGRYQDAALEARYQESLRYDRRARTWLIGGEAALLGSAAMFIWEFLRPSGLPDNIPFDPEVSQQAGTTRLTFQVAF